MHYHSLSRLIPCFLPFFEDFQIGVSDSSLDISTNSASKCNIYTSKSTFEFRQVETNQILKIEVFVIIKGEA